MKFLVTRAKYPLDELWVRHQMGLSHRNVKWTRSPYVSASLVKVQGVIVYVQLSFPGILREGHGEQIPVCKHSSRSISYA
jgi:hypothetical protein